MQDIDSQFALEHEAIREYGVYPLLRSIDKSLHELREDMYIFRRDITARVSVLEQTQEKHSQDISELKQDTAILRNDVAELKDGMKELRHDVSDIKGDIKALAAGFGAAQSRFNWGLVILGIIVGLIQLLK